MTAENFEGNFEVDKFLCWNFLINIYCPKTNIYFEGDFTFTTPVYELQAEAMSGNINIKRRKLFISAIFR